ncbi:Protein of unknown function [Lentibacillus halodurans]|uniref:Coat F domain-containing protein n=1 Tax=Lentibacillus halodurans TaxID=237679 RepID=A0A1I0Z9R9_9BACI|nr:DUF3231 family protein [Lentibacillus halodurans]SFB21876.1 Protein of unknown function [Lentibacillus halodurans]
MDNTEQLTAQEVTNLWSSYLGNTMAVGFTKYLIKIANDTDIKHSFEHALSLATYEVDGARELFRHYNHPLPQGFSGEDFNMTAPPPI